MWVGKREQIASRALRLATDTHFMFTNELAEEMASFRATGKGDAHREPVSSCLFFQFHIHELRGGEQGRDQDVLLKVDTSDDCSCCTWPVLLVWLHEQLWHQCCYLLHVVADVPTTGSTEDHRHGSSWSFFLQMLLSLNLILWVVQLNGLIYIYTHPCIENLFFILHSGYLEWI